MGMSWRSLRSLLKSCFASLALDIRLIALISRPVWGILQLNSSGISLSTIICLVCLVYRGLLGIILLFTESSTSSSGPGTVARGTWSAWAWAKCASGHVSTLGNEQ